MANDEALLYYTAHPFLKVSTEMSQVLDLAMSNWAFCQFYTSWKEYLATSAFISPLSQSETTLLEATVSPTFAQIQEHELITGGDEGRRTLANKFLDNLKIAAQVLAFKYVGEKINSTITDWLTVCGELARHQLWSDTGIQWSLYLVQPDVLAKSSEWLSFYTNLSLPFYESSVDFIEDNYKSIAVLGNEKVTAEIVDRTARIVAERAFLYTWRKEWLTYRIRKSITKYTPEFSGEEELTTRLNAIQEKEAVIRKGFFSFSGAVGIENFLLDVENKASAAAVQQARNYLPTVDRWPNLFASIARSVMGDPKHTNFLLEVTGLANEDQLKALQSITVEAVKISDAIIPGLDQGYAVWQQGVKFDSLLEGPLATVRNVLGGVKGALATGENYREGINDLRLEVQKNVLEWYKAGKDLVLAPIKDIANGLGDLGRVGSLPEGVTMKFILPQPVVGSDNLVSELTTSLSTLRAQSPVFKNDSETDIGAVMLVMYSNDPLGSLLLWVLMTSVIFGYNFSSIAKKDKVDWVDEIIQLAKSSGQTIIAQQFEALVAAGKAPSGAELGQIYGGFENIWEQTAETNKSFSSWADSVVTQGKKLVESGTKTVAAFQEAWTGLTQGPVKVDQQPVLNAGLISSRPVTLDGEPLEGISNPFDNWYEIFSLKGLLGPIGNAADTVLQATSDTLKEGSAIYSMIATGVDKHADAYVNIATSALDATNQAAQIGLKAGDQAIDAIDLALSSLSLPTFGALLVPPVKGGTEKLRFTLAQMIQDNPTKPPELDSPYGLIMPLLVVVASDVTNQARTAWDGVNSMLKIVKGKVIDETTGQPVPEDTLLRNMGASNYADALKNLNNLVNSPPGT